MGIATHRSQKRGTLDPLTAARVVVNHPTWVLGTQLDSYKSTACSAAESSLQPQH